MNKALAVTKTTKINADASKVWDALTNPALIKQYLFGTDVVSDWNVGSEIIFQGNWEGKAYRDKGRIVKLEAEKILQYTYWSGFSGLEDTEENYSLVTFEIRRDKEKTVLTITQQGFANEQAQSHAEQSWGMVGEKIKSIAEGTQ